MLLSHYPHILCIQFTCSYTHKPTHSNQMQIYFIWMHVEHMDSSSIKGWSIGIELSRTNVSCRRTHSRSQAEAHHHITVDLYPAETTQNKLTQKRAHVLCIPHELNRNNRRQNGVPTYSRPKNDDAWIPRKIVMEIQWSSITTRLCVHPVPTIVSVRSIHPSPLVHISLDSVAHI